MKRTYAHFPRSLNAGKERQLLDLFPAFHVGLGAVQARLRRQILAGERMPLYPGLKGHACAGGLSARQMKSVGNMVRGSYKSWAALLEDAVRPVITGSPLNDMERTTLYRLNKHHRWFEKQPMLLWHRDPKTGKLEPAGRRGKHTVELAVDPSLVKLQRRIVKHCMKHCHFPNLKHVNTLVLDSIIAKPERPSEPGDGMVSWWVKVATLTAGSPVMVPLTRNPWFEHSHTNALDMGGGLCGVIQLTRRAGRIASLGLVLDIPDADTRDKGDVIGIDYGMSDALLAVSDGRLLGHAMLDRIREYDRRLEERARWMQQRGMKPTRDQQYRRLQNRIRSYVSNEIGRQLNRIALRDGDARVREIVVEQLDFRYGGMSPRMNRLITRTGRKVFKLRLQNMTERHGITVTQIPSPYTSQECSGCGYTSQSNRPKRSMFSCRFCGKKMHADINAALTIRSRRSWHQPDNTGPLSRKNTLRLLDERHRQRWHKPKQGAVPDVTGAPGDPQPAPQRDAWNRNQHTCHTMA